MRYLSEDPEQVPTPEALWEVFPYLCFPELSAPRITVTEREISVYDKDCEWAVQSDFIMADGAGTMIFKCQKPPHIISVEDSGGYNWSLESAAGRLLPQVKMLELVERHAESWVFKGIYGDDRKFEIRAEVAALEWVYDFSVAADEDLEEEQAPDSRPPLSAGGVIMTLPNGLSLADNWAITNPKDQHVLGKIAFGVMLYFWENQDTPQKRQAVLDILSDYRKIVGPRFRWTTNPTSGVYKKLPKGFDSYITPDQWIMKADDYGWDFIYHGGQRNVDASDVAFEVSTGGAETGYRGFSYLFCHFPLGTFKESKLDPVKTISKWCSWLKPCHGYSGCFLSPCEIFSGGPLADDMNYSLAFALPGLQINSPSSQMASLDDGMSIKGVDWLTILSEPLLEELGGGAAVINKMKAIGQPCHSYDGGLILVAGDAPHLGYEGINDPELAAYHQVAVIVEPIRVKNHKRSFKNAMGRYPGGNALDLETTRAWLARFSPKEG